MTTIDLHPETITPVSTPRLSRSAGYGRPAAPVRIVHVGLGNFFRAHQAWYTDQAPDADQWGIAAFTGRSPAMADALNPQDGLYTLITRGPSAAPRHPGQGVAASRDLPVPDHSGRSEEEVLREIPGLPSVARDDSGGAAGNDSPGAAPIQPTGDSLQVISSISAVHAASDHAAWQGYWADPQVAIVTLTITEAGYMRAADGGLDVSRADVQADIAALRANPDAPASTAPGKIVSGYLTRRTAGAGAIAIVPCDNLPENGPALARVVDDFIAAVDPTLADWAAENVAFGTTMVDRITPATTDEHRDAVRAELGVLDVAPVPTEPFSEWVIAGEFPKGRPAWDAAGAAIVADVVPFEQRKLWLLNGSHSLLAYAGTILGHETVADAIADPVARGWVQEWWDEASAHLSLPAEDVAEYRQALLDRFANPNIRHSLAQIAADGSQKIAVRIVPTLRAERAAGRVPLGATRAIAAWTCHLRGVGAPVRDARNAEVARLAEGTLKQSVAAVLEFLGADLAADPQVFAAVLAQANDLMSRA